MAKEIDNTVRRGRIGNNSADITQMTTTMDKYGDPKKLEWKGNFDIEKDGLRFVGTWKVTENTQSGWINWDMKAKSVTYASNGEKLSASAKKSISDDLMYSIVKAIESMHFSWGALSMTDEIRWTGL